MGLAYIKVIVDLKLGLMFVCFFKAPLKVPLTYDSKNGGCMPTQGSIFVRSKEAHFIMCDG
jgi:hypothetical protein